MMPITKSTPITGACHVQRFWKDSPDSPSISSRCETVTSTTTDYNRSAGDISESVENDLYKSNSTFDNLSLSELTSLERRYRSALQSIEEQIGKEYGIQKDDKKGARQDPQKIGNQRTDKELEDINRKKLTAKKELGNINRMKLIARKELGTINQKKLIAKKELGTIDRRKLFAQRELGTINSKKLSAKKELGNINQSKQVAERELKDIQDRRQVVENELKRHDLPRYLENRNTSRQSTPTFEPFKDYQRNDQENEGNYCSSQILCENQNLKREKGILYTCLETLQRDFDTKRFDLQRLNCDIFHWSQFCQQQTEVVQRLEEEKDVLKQELREMERICQCNHGTDRKYIYDDEEAGNHQHTNDFGPSNETNQQHETNRCDSNTYKKSLGRSGWSCQEDIDLSVKKRKF